LNNGSEAVAGKGNAVGRYVRPTRRVSLATTVGQGDATVGYWLGTAGDGVSKLIVAPKSTEIKLAWGSYGITRGVFNTSYGLPNTNTLYGYGNSTAAGHPAAYYCKTLTTGGYNTWYMPADNELLTMYSNHAATPFSVSNGFNTSGDVWSSTEKDNYAGKYRNLMSGADGSNGSKKVLITVRAIRGL
jgi:hypothetical protein